MSADLEESLELGLDFAKVQSVAGTGQAVVPVVLQNVDTLEVLFLAYANQIAIETALDEGIAVLWSTSRNELWRKGATSGDVLDLIEIRVNCEQNSVLYLVRPANRGVCHTRDEAGETRPGCFYRRIESAGSLAFVSAVAGRRPDTV